MCDKTQETDSMKAGSDVRLKPDWRNWAAGKGILHIAANAQVEAYKAALRGKCQEKFAL
ncbi:hypothetical protein AGMMS49974_06400 [Deltaproteobacteria bacterium]|nr:hypothetical protein AGMMS49974_06400 [Deltaproteobacteria bacterium]